MARGRLTTAGLAKLATDGVSADRFPSLSLGTGSQDFSLALAALAALLETDDTTGLLRYGNSADIQTYLGNADANDTLTEVGLLTEEGTLALYDTFLNPVEKNAAQSFLMHVAMTLHNADSGACLTGAGLTAAMEGGFTVDSFPYFGVGSGSKPFKASLAAVGNEIQRVPTAGVSVSGSTVTIDGYFLQSQGNGTWTELFGWDASTGGNLLWYMPLSPSVIKDSSVAKVATVTLTLANWS